MSTFLLIPGAGGVAWYWSRVAPLLEAEGHRAIPVDLPGGDDTAGLQEYADLVVQAAEDVDDELVVVAQSLGGFTAPLVCDRLAVARLVFVNAMIPLPGERVGDWWDNTGSQAARTEAAKAGGYPTESDLVSYFLHDVPPEVAAEGEPHQRPEADAVFASVCAFDAWPPVPISVVTGADDRFFPAAFQRAVARDRLGIEPEVVAGGHLVALANPAGLAARLTRGVAATDRTR